MSTETIDKPELVIGLVGPDEAKIDALFKERGVDRDDPANEVVIFKTIYETRNGGINPVEPDSYGLTIYPRS